MFKFRVGPILLLVVSVFFIGLSSKYNWATELIFTNTTNRFLREKLSFLFAKTNVPVGEILNIILLMLFIYIIVNFFMKIFKKGYTLKYIARLFWGIVNIGSILLFVYLLLYGLNYHVPSLETSFIDKYNKKFSTQVKINVDNEKRTEVFKYLEQKTLEAREIAAQNNNNRNLEIGNLSSQAVEGYRSISETFSKLDGNFSPVKTSFLSPVLLYFGLDGQYHIFTNESVLNDNIPAVYKPFIVSKYMAYQRGIVKDDEAMFFAYLACINNTDPQFKYSGYLAMLAVVTESLRTNDRMDYNVFMNSLDENVKNDLMKIEKYKEMYGEGRKIKNSFDYYFKRLNGDVRGDDVETQTTNLVSTYYSLFTYQ
ncbi:DUF3810 family protein [Peptostreptococcus faecalis]|uniref:DUF3810 family protein n=1 Tax=Peptostreptococcus faecalis TaxID=2045015 RepID=UPI000C7C33ED|nr:DUF3810 family protein [Peptostreptococcus faecalis]